MMTAIEILGVPFSNYVRCALMALEEKGVPYTLVPCRAHVPDVQAIHPFGKIPCLRQGGFTLCETLAIATYIDKAFAGPRLFPEEAKAAAVCTQWVSLANTTMVPAMQGYAMAYFFPRTPDQEPDPAMIAASFPKVEEYLGVIGRAVEATGYLAGDSFTYADIAMLPMLAYLKDLPESGAIFSPPLTAYLERHAERASFKATMPPPMEELLAITKKLAREMFAAKAA